MNTFLKTYEQVIKEQIVLGTLLLTLLKTGWKNSIKINCIPLDLLIVKLAAYRFDIHAWALILTYLKNRKKSIQINSTHSSFKNIISGAPQESTVGPILFNLLINDLFHIIKKPQHSILQMITLCLLLPKQLKAFFIFYSGNLEKSLNDPTKKNDN